MYFIIVTYNGIDQWDKSYTKVEKHKSYQNFAKNKKEYEKDPLWTIETCIEGNELVIL